jgi:ADP-ribose pyrophosphatase YjhB (NUDIX family)
VSFDEMLDVVDENDIVLYQATKAECYKNRLRKRIVCIAVIDPITKNIALQTRGKDVSWEPGYYCVSACGHVGAGEEWDVAAQRELKEEMGIDAPLEYIDKIAFTDKTGHEFILGIYTTEYPHSELKADPREVDQIFSMTENEVNDLLARGEKLHNLLVPVITAVLKNKHENHSE